MEQDVILKCAPFIMNTLVLAPNYAIIGDNIIYMWLLPHYICNSPFHLSKTILIGLLMKHDVTSGLPFACVRSSVCMHVNGKLIHV